MHHPHSLYGAIAPLYYVSRALGLASFAFSKNQTSATNIDPVRVSTYALLYTVLIFCTLALLFPFSFHWYIHNFYPKFDYSLSVPHAANQCFTFVTVLVSLVLSATCTGSEVQKALLQFTVVDHILFCKQQLEGMYRRMRRLLGVQMGVLATALVAWSATGVLLDTNVKNEGDAVLHHLIHALCVVTAVQYCDLVLLLRLRLRAVNEQLRSALRTSNAQQLRFVGVVSVADSLRTGTSALAPAPASTWPLRPPRRSDFAAAPVQCISGQKVRYLRRAHLLLSQLAALVNGAYNAQMLLLVASLFTGIVTNLFVPIVEVTRHGVRLSGADAALLAGGLAWSTGVLTALAAVSHAVKQEARRTPVLVLKLMLFQDSGRDAAAQLRGFSHQLLHSRVQLTACGLFRVDLTLLYNVAGAVTTYLVFLMQFLMSGSSRDSSSLE